VEPFSWGIPLGPPRLEGLVRKRDDDRTSPLSVLASRRLNEILKRQRAKK
jgi:hypothetical protein